MLIDVLVKRPEKGRPKRILVLKCDHCQIHFELKYAKSILQRSLHFHSIECKNESQRRGGALAKVIIETCQAKYGTDNPNQSDLVRQKKIATCRERYGTDFVLASPAVRQKSTETLKQRYGVSSYLSSAECRIRLEKTSLEKWGVSHPSQSSEIKEKKREAAVTRYGVDNVSQSEEVKASKRQTCQVRYGVENTFQSRTLMSKVDRAAAYRKRLDTMRRDGTVKKSLPEDRLYELLHSVFGDVERQVIINDRWPIDFYVKSMDIYIQFDGVYWHGLDRPIDVIAKHKTSQDIIIHKKWLTDREQDTWFESNGLRLFRISDSSDDALHNFVDQLTSV